MIDLTPLDVRKKREDFRKVLRGYDPEDVDTFLELVAERMEELVKANLTLQERSDRLQEQVSSQMGRENAVQQALVTAQELRDDIRGQARQEADEILVRAEKEAELLRKEAGAEAEKIVAQAHRQLEQRGRALEELERKRIRFLRSFRALLERELDVVEVEEGRAPLEESPVELEFGGGRPAAPREAPRPPVSTGAEAGPERASEAPSPAAEAPREEPPPEAPEASARPTGPPPATEPAPTRPRAPDPFGPEVRSPTPEEPEDTATPPGEGVRLADAPPSAERGGTGDAVPVSSEAPTPDPGASPADEERESAAVEGESSSEEDDPKRWLSSLVERELNEKTDEDSWS